MNTRPSNFWRWEWKIGRGKYVLWGLGLFLAKFSLDRAVSRFLYDRLWSILDYLRPAGLLPSSSNTAQLLTLLAISLPFLGAGIVLTLARLRSAGLPLWLVVLFVVPVVKFLLFAVLCLLPSRDMAGAGQSATGETSGDGVRLLPANHLRSAALGILAASLLMLPVVWLGTTVLKDYGWALFIGVPFCMGFIAVLIYGFRLRRRLGTSIIVAISTIGLAGVVMMLIAMEGLICLLMAAPIAVVMAALGGAAAHGIQSGLNWRDDSTKLFCPAILAVPLLMGAEHHEKPDAPLLKVTTSVEVNAPPETVWKNVVTFSELPPPKEWLFRAGIAYPVRAEIRGQGRGAVRYCCSSTGPFVEPIEVWDEPRLLRFAVTENPSPMQELSPYHELHPPHLDGFLVSRAGQFNLVRLPNGRTLLEGTTWYQHNLWPATYWHWWSDYIIHRIHLRVLNHVKVLSEEVPESP